MEIFLLTAGVVLTVAACENRYSRTRSTYDDDYDLGSSSSYHQRSHNHCYRCNQKTSCQNQTATGGLLSVPGLGISAGQQVAPRVESTSTRTSGLSSSKESKIINKSLQTKSKTQSAPKPEVVSQKYQKRFQRRIQRTKSLQNRNHKLLQSLLVAHLSSINQVHKGSYLFQICLNGAKGGLLLD